MVLSVFKKEARTKLSGKWTKTFILTTLYGIILFILSFIESFFSDSIQTILSIIFIIIKAPLNFGLINCFIKLYYGENVKYFDIFSIGFKNFKKSLSITFYILFKMLLPFLLIIISYAVAIISLYMAFASDNNFFKILSAIGYICVAIFIIYAVMKYLYYNLALYFAIDNPNMTAKESVLESKKIMKNNRLKLFSLQFSFIGWAFLSTLIFGIGYLWLTPYMQFSFINFYRHLLEKSTNN